MNRVPSWLEHCVNCYVDLTLYVCVTIVIMISYKHFLV